MPRLRFTVGQMMVAVAISGLLLGGATSVQNRRQRFLERARAINMPNHLGVPTVIGYDKKRDLILLDWDSREREDAHFAALKRKYEYAARYPWLPARPDPPEPRRAARRSRRDSGSPCGG